MTAVKFGNAALTEFGDTTQTKPGGVTVHPSGGPNNAPYFELYGDDSILIPTVDTTNVREHLIAFPGSSNASSNPAWFANGATIARALAVRLPTLAGARTGLVYAGDEIHGSFPATGPAPTNGVVWERGAGTRYWRWYERGGNSNTSFLTQWIFGPNDGSSTSDGVHFQEDMVGGNIPIVLDQWEFFSWSITLDNAGAGTFDLYHWNTATQSWDHKVSKSGIYTSYPAQPFPMMSIYYPATGTDTAGVNKDSVHYAGGYYGDSLADVQAAHMADMGLSYQIDQGGQVAAFNPWGDPMRFDAPAWNAAAVTPDDNSDIATVSRAVYVGSAGDLKVTMASGDVVTFSAVPAGSLLPFGVARVWSTGTTATQIVAVW